MQDAKICKLGTTAEAPAEGVKALVGPDEVGKELTATGRIRILTMTSRLGVALAVQAMQEITKQQLRERLRKDLQDLDYSALELRILAQKEGGPPAALLRDRRKAQWKSEFSGSVRKMRKGRL